LKEKVVMRLLTVTQAMRSLELTSTDLRQERNAAGMMKRPRVWYGQKKCKNERARRKTDIY
jgi:hypothetical protein